jgi:CxxC motif-containing protein
VKDRLLTCIVCPRGCALTVHFDEAGNPISVEGNACKRGVVYAEKECTHPERTVTTTVRTESGAVVAVKTASTVPKEKVFDVMAEINKACAKMPVSIGDVIIENVAETGVKVVATADCL